MAFSTLKHGFESRWGYLFFMFSILRDKYLITIFGLSFFTLLIAFLIVFSKISEITNLLIIHFDAYRGINIFGDKIDIFGVFASAFAAEAINFFLSSFLYNRERFISYVLSFGSFALSILILIAVSVIISVN